MTQSLFMRRAGGKRYPAWLPAAVVAVVVALVGARLIALSARDHARDLHHAAQAAVARETHQIEVELQALMDRARYESHRAAGTLDNPSPPPWTAVPSRNAFWTAGKGGLLRTGDEDPAVSRALSNEWMAAPARAAAAAGLFGPVRYGSQWFVAAQAPVELPRAGSVTDDARAFAYETLDGLLLQAGLGRLTREGYDFEVFQDARNPSEPRVFLRSNAAPLAEPESGAIQLQGAAGSSAVPYLTLAVRPQGGWYPTGPLVADIALLALLAWALALGAYDLSYGVSRAKRALATVRGRLRAVNARLTAEIEQHDALQKNLEHARYHDPSTGLPNRRYFMDRVDRALRDLHARRRQRLSYAGDTGPALSAISWGPAPRRPA